MRACRNCGAEYSSGGRYSCSVECRDEYQMKQRREGVDLKRTCQACGKEFEVDFFERKGNAKLCSMACIGKNNQKLLKGRRDPEKWEEYSCMTCGKKGERLKGGQGGNIRQYCSRACRSKNTWKTRRLSDKMRSKTYLVTLKDGRDLKVRSRWEAAFIKDYLEPKGLRWKYEEKTFQLPNGHTYTPDFYIEDQDKYIEIKGFERGPSLKNVKSLRGLGRNVLYATGEVLEEDFGLNLRPEYLSGLVREFVDETV
jgi:hypothetical protein